MDILGNAVSSVGYGQSLLGKRPLLSSEEGSFKRLKVGDPSYELPSSEGTVGQVMVAQGDGTVEWKEVDAEWDEQTRNLNRGQPLTFSNVGDTVVSSVGSVNEGEIGLLAPNGVTVSDNVVVDGNIVLGSLGELQWPSVKIKERGVEKAEIVAPTECAIDTLYLHVRPLQYAENEDLRVDFDHGTTGGDIVERHVLPDYNTSRRYDAFKIVDEYTPSFGIRSEIGRTVFASQRQVHEWNQSFNNDVTFAGQVFVGDVGTTNWNLNTTRGAVGTVLTAGPAGSVQWLAPAIQQQPCSGSWYIRDNSQLTAFQIGAVNTWVTLTGNPALNAVSVVGVLYSNLPTGHQWQNISGVTVKWKVDINLSIRNITAVKDAWLTFEANIAKNGVPVQVDGAAVLTSANADQYPNQVSYSTILSFAPGDVMTILGINKTNTDSIGAMWVNLCITSII